MMQMTQTSDRAEIHRLMTEDQRDHRRNHELRAAIQMLRLAEYDANAEGQPEQAAKIRAAIDIIVQEVRRRG